MLGVCYLPAPFTSGLLAPSTAVPIPIKQQSSILAKAIKLPTESTMATQIDKFNVLA